MNSIKKLYFSLFMIFCISMMFVGQAFAYAGWYKNANGTWNYYRADGTMVKNSWEQIGGRWYVFVGDGTMVKDQWILSNGNWYYINIDGGLLANQWLGYKGDWYWLQEDGSMLRDGKAPDGSKVNEDGHYVGTGAFGPAAK